MSNTVAVLISLAGLVGQPASADEVEEAFLKSRLALSSGTLTVRAETQRTGPKATREKSVTKIWFTNAHFRCDKTASSEGKEYRKVYCENCERDGYYAFFDAKNLEPGSTVIPLGLRPLGDQKNLENQKGGARINSHLKYDPRVIGIFTSAYDAYPMKKLAAAAGRTDRDEVTPEKVRWRDHDAVVVSYTLKNALMVRTTYVPDMEYLIVKCESAANAKGKKTEQVMEVEPARYGLKGPWFPSKVSIRHTSDGKETYTAKLEISEVDFETPVAGDHFRLVGMAIPKGTEIDLRPETPGTHYWDGEKIAAKTQKNVDSDLPAPTPQSSRQWLIVLSIFTAVAAALALAWYLIRASKGRTGA